MTLKLLYWTFWGLVSLADCAGYTTDPAFTWECETGMTLPSGRYLPHPPQYVAPPGPIAGSWYPNESEPLRPIQRLERVGIDFNTGEGITSARPQTPPRPTACQPACNGSEYRDVLVNVKEAKSSLTFGAGVNSDSGLNGSIRLNGSVRRPAQVTYAVADLIVPVSDDLPPVFCKPETRAALGTLAPAVYSSPARACTPQPAAPKPLAITAAAACDKPRTCPSPAPARHVGKTCEDDLIRLITSTIAPESWQCNGGRGSIQYYPLGMALVVQNEPEVQEKVSKLLDGLRKKQDEVYREFSLELRLGEGRGKDERILQAPKVTFCQHQTFTVHVGQEIALATGTLGDFVRSDNPVQQAAYSARPVSNGSDKLPDTVSVGVSMKGRVTPSAGKQVRVDLEVKTGELEEARKNGVMVTTRAVRLVSHVVPGGACRVALERDMHGEEVRWLEFTVREVAQK